MSSTSNRGLVLAFLGMATLSLLGGALIQDGIEQLFLGVAALVLGLAFLMAATRGTRAHGMARVMAGLGGGALLMAALGLGMGSVWMIFLQGGLGILVGFVGLPAAFVVGIWGRLLIQMARSGMER